MTSSPALDYGQLYRVLAESASDAIITIDETSTVLSVNPAAERMFGYPAHEIVGGPLSRLMPERMRARHTAGIARYMATGMRSMSWHGMQLPILTSDGREVTAEISFGEFETDGRRIFSAVLRDVTSRLAAEAALAESAELLQDQAAELEQQVEAAQTLADDLEQANADLAQSAAELQARSRVVEQSADRARRLLVLSTSLNEALTVDAVAAVIFREAMAAVGADAGSLALVRNGTDGEREFEIMHTNGFSAELVREHQRFPVRPGGPLSDAVLSQHAVLIESRASSPYPSLLDVGYEGFAAVPVAHGGKPIAGVSFSFAEPQHFDAETRTFLETLGQLCAQALERARLYDAEARQFTRVQFLADATRTLAASLDYETTLRSVASSTVPVLADWCAVDVIDDPTQHAWPPKLERLAVIHENPERRALGLALQARFPTDWSAPTGIAKALHDGVPQFVPVVTDAMITATARDAEHLAVLRELQFSSVIIAPLIARGLTLGALTLAMSESGRHYNDADFALAQDLAQRAAVAIDNARLFRAAETAVHAAERASAEARAANDAKSTFLATMSHEIRTPINAVLGYTDLLQLGISGPLTDAQQQHLARIHESTQHLLGLIEEVLDFAKIEAGTLRLDVSDTHSGATANAALGLVRAQAQARGVAVSSECEGDCAAVYVGDEGRVRQILSNLLVNAVKFTHAGGSVACRCVLTSDAPTLPAPMRGIPHVGFHVSDTGIGIAADQLERIFEPFTQAEVDTRNPYTRQQGGAGLGLAISRHLAHLMNGEITVQSEAGKGSTFTLWLPAAS